jgi:acetylornithine deacetylase/succinyl-diaminopimelate desuccinylase-like protein
LAVTAHTDTVFPAGTDLSIRRDDGLQRIYGPGLGDNSVGVAALLWLAEQLRTLPPPPVDIWLVANTGEEGNGNLRGMRAAMDRLQSVAGACIVLEGMGLSRIVHRALGSRRFRIVVKAPGGHSWSDFGAASAVHVLVQLAADLSRLKPPAVPRTTFNIGVIAGGTSVNTIAQHASLELDLRSEDPATLTGLVAQVQHVVARYQTSRWQQAGVHVMVEVIGDRPGGAVADDHPLVQAAFRSLTSLGIPPQGNMRISSTDANIPLSRGVPAVCIGITDGANAHRFDEWITPELLPKGMQHLMALTVWAASWLGKG